MVQERLKDVEAQYFETGVSLLEAEYGTITEELGSDGTVLSRRRPGESGEAM